MTETLCRQVFQAQTLCLICLVDAVVVWAGCQYLHRLADGCLGCAGASFHPLHCLFASLLRVGKAEQYLKGEVPRIIEFANSIARDSTMDDTVVRNCVNLLGDVCTVIPNVGAAFNNSSKEWEQLMVYCQDSGHLLGDTEWAIQAVRNTMTGSS